MESLGYEVIAIDFLNPQYSNRYNFLQPVIDALNQGEQAKAATRARDMAAIGVPLWLTAAKGGGIGGGDVKLCAALGALLGLEKMLFLLILALLSITASGKLKKKRSLPFAPFVWGAFYILLVVEIIQRSC